MDFGIEFDTSGEFFHEIGELKRQRRWQLRLVVGPPRLPLPRSAARIVTVLGVVGVFGVRVRLWVPSAATAAAAAGGLLLAAGAVLVGGAAVGIGQPVLGEQRFEDLGLVAGGGV